MKAFFKSISKILEIALIFLVFLEQIPRLCFDMYIHGNIPMNIHVKYKN